MKLAFIGYTSSPEYDQPETWLKRINGYTGILESLSAHHEVIAIERINYEGVFEERGVTYHFIRLKKKVVRFPRRIHDLLKRLRPDVVFVNGLSSPLQVIQLRWKLGKGVKIFLIHRSEKPPGGIKKFLQKIADKYVNAYLFPSSEFGKQWIEDGNIRDRGKIHEVMHGSSAYCPEDRAAARERLTLTGTPVFLWVGRLEANKNPFTVVKGFIDFLGTQPSARLYMIYQTEELLQEVKQLVNRDERTRKAIHLAGRIPHEQLQSWYNGADFIISGSHYEGGGIAVCEAMSCGCIPILTDIISFRRLTGPGQCGLLYQAGNSGSLLSALRKTIEMDQALERSRTINRFREELSFDAIARKINKIIASS